MSYRRLPYAVRYVIALVAWSFIVTVDIMLRVLFVPLIFFSWLFTGFGQTQHGAQHNMNLVDFYTRPLMRLPRLLGGRSHPAKRNPGLTHRVPDSGV